MYRIAPVTAFQTQQWWWKELKKIPEADQATPFLIIAHFDFQTN
jgi:hypothetical protein